jgi:hypothetical protein
VVTDHVLSAIIELVLNWRRVKRRLQLGSDLIQTFTPIKAIKVMNMRQIITIYLNENKIMARNLLLQWNLELEVSIRGMFCG